MLRKPCISTQSSWLKVGYSGDGLRRSTNFNCEVDSTTAIGIAFGRRKDLGV